MTPVGWMVAGALGTSAIAAAVTPDDDALEIVLGMAAPLVAVAGTWLAASRTVRRDPALLLSVMMKGFGLKTIFFCAYVVIALTAFGLSPLPFVVSFTAYYIALYFVGALLLSRLVGSCLRQAR